MNDKIKFPAQEWLGYDPEKGDIHGYTFEQMREFAELIVLECVELCESATKFNKQTKATLTENYLIEKMVISGCIAQSEKLAIGIKQHFGVESRTNEAYKAEKEAQKQLLQEMFEEDKT